MAKHNSKDITKKNFKINSKQNSERIIESNKKSFSGHQTKKSENQKKAKVALSQRNKIAKRKRVKMRRRNKNLKKNIRRRTPRRNRIINLEVDNIHNNIANDFIERGNINEERSLNIPHTFSLDDHRVLQLSDLNEENNNSINEENLNFNSNIYLNTDNNIINEISIDQNNDEELLDLSYVRNISSNHPNRIKKVKISFDMLPKIKIGDISNLLDEQCIICLEYFLKDEFITTLSCSHVFHSLCLKEWILRKTTCPLCRSNIGGKRI
jgi:hypothetical protein